MAVLARDVLGRTNVLTVTADSPSIAREDLADARQLACDLHLEHRVIATREVEDPGYRANTTARCYLCKRTLFDELGVLAEALRVPAVFYGAIGDDQLSERPGQRAALERGVRAPLQEVGLAKWDVRLLAWEFGLPNWDRPQNACLASRIPHGQEVTEEKLRQVEAAESFLRSQGFRQVRVRHAGTHARIEVTPEEIPRLERRALDPALGMVFSQLGFAAMIVDPRGYRAGGADAKERRPSPTAFPTHP